MYNRLIFYLLLLFCVSCGWERPTPWEPSENTKSSISSLKEGGALETFDIPSEANGIDDIYSRLENEINSNLADPNLPDRLKDALKNDWAMVSGGAPIDRRNYEIPFMPPVEEQDPNLSYWTTGSDGKVFYFAFPKGICGPFLFDERYGPSSTGYFCWKD